MKVLSAILFVTGIYFALLVWILIPSPVGIFLPKYEYKAHDVILSIVGSLTALSGYFVWLGWGYYSLKGRYLKMTKRKFWTLSLLQHSAWLLFLPMFSDITVWAFLIDGEYDLIKLWIVANIVIAIVAIFWKTKDEQNQSVVTTQETAPPAS